MGNVMRGKWIEGLMGILLVLILVSLSPAKEIKPGVTISKDNYAQYLDSLKKITDRATYLTLTDDLRAGLITVPVVETQSYSPAKPYGEATLKNHKLCRVDSSGALLGWVSGAPFPEPVTGLELAWDFDKRQMTSDQYSFEGDFLLFDKTGKMERSFSWHYWKMFYCGRFEIPPIPDTPGNKKGIHMKESMAVLRPFDVKGFCMMRTRYLAIDKEDEVYDYIPAIRRIRRMSGADVCDPVLGSDTIYDDFDYCRQKVDPRICEYSMSKRDLLVPCHKKEPMGPVDSTAMTVRGKALQTEWEIRPVWALEIKTSDPNYAYGRRILYMEKLRGTFVGVSGEFFDQRGRLFRSETPAINSYVGAPTFSNKGWHGARYNNHLTDHCTILMHKGTHLDPVINTKIFSFKWILRQAR